LNPTGIRVAGIRMIPVAGGKYKVWTKRIGSGSVKVLLLHGGPGFPHDYLEAMESFLPQAGIEMYYYDQLGVGNSDVPMIRRSGLCLDISARSRRFVAD
jgi:proline iminopeptidase